MNEAQARALAAQVLARIAPEGDLGQVRDDEDLREALDLDSMDFMNFIIGLSEGSGVAIPESEAARMHSLAAVVGWLARPPT